MRTLRLTAILLLMAGTGVPSAVAGSSSADMTVSVHVVARTIVTVDREPQEVRLTAEDVARGYVDMPSAVALRIRSNARKGFSIQFEPVAYPFASAQIVWGSQQAVVSADGSWLTRSYVPGEQAATFNVRLRLASDAAVGSYPWPVRFDASSL